MWFFQAQQGLRGGLLSVLQCIAEEITQLHAKIERKTEVEEAHLKVAADLQREASSKFTAFEQDIGRNQGVQQGHHADLQARLEQFSERSAEEVASMSKQVERLAATVSELQRKASTAVEFQTEAGKGAMQVRFGWRGRTGRGRYFFQLSSASCTSDSMVYQFLDSV